MNDVLFKDLSALRLCLSPRTIITCGHASRIGLSVDSKGVDWPELVVPVHACRSSFDATVPLQLLHSEGC